MKIGALGFIVLIGIVLPSVVSTTRLNAGHPHDEDEKLRDMIAESLNRVDATLAGAAGTLRRYDPADDVATTGIRSSMDETLVEMKGLRTELHRTADPKADHGSDALRAYEKAARELERMSTAFHNMAKQLVGAKKRKA